MLHWPAYYYTKLSGRIIFRIELVKIGHADYGFLYQKNEQCENTQKPHGRRQTNRLMSNKLLAGKSKTKSWKHLYCFEKPALSIKQRSIRSANQQWRHGQQRARGSHNFSQSRTRQHWSFENFAANFGVLLHDFDAAHASHIREKWRHTTKVFSVSSSLDDTPFAPLWR